MGKKIANASNVRKEGKKDLQEVKRKIKINSINKNIIKTQSIKPELALKNNTQRNIIHNKKNSIKLEKNMKKYQRFVEYYVHTILYLHDAKCKIEQNLELKQ